jgi:hypothetical protein
MSTSAHVYSDVYIIDVLYIFKSIKTLRYSCFLTPVISASLPLLNSPDVNKTPSNPLYIRLSLYPEVNRLHLTSGCFWGALGDAVFLLAYPHPHNGKNVRYNKGF